MTPDETFDVSDSACSRVASFARPGIESRIARVRSLSAFRYARRSGPLSSIQRYGSTTVVPKYVSVTGMRFASGGGGSAAPATVVQASTHATAIAQTFVLIRRSVGRRAAGTLRLSCATAQTAPAGS